MVLDEVLNNRILLHWPDSRLSGNSSAHWRQRKEAKDIEKMMTKSALQNTNIDLPTGNMSQRVVFFPPSNHRRDDDNWYIAIKAARDTIFSSCGRDDSAIRMTIIEWGEPCKGGAVGLEYMPFDDYSECGKETVKAWK